MMERTGAPERSVHSNLFSTRLETAYLALKDPDEDDLMAFLARYRGSDRKVLDNVLPRMRVALLSDRAISRLLEAVVKRADRTLSLREGRRHDDHLGFLLGFLARVVIRADPETALKVFRWTRDVLISPFLWWTCYENCDDVLKGAIEAMGNSERQVALELALDLKLPIEAGAAAIERRWPELIGSFSGEDLRRFEMTSKTSRRIDDLIALLRTSQTLDRGRALMRLHALHKEEKLTDAQTNALEAAIWANCSESGWPTDTDLHPWIFLDLPGHRRADPLFKTAIVEPVSKGEISDFLMLNLRAGLNLLVTSVEHETIAACTRHCVAWRPKSLEREEKTSFFSDEVGLEIVTAKEVGHTLAQTLLPAIQPEHVTDELASSLLGLRDLPHIPTISATAFHFARLFPDQRQAALAMVRVAIASRDPDRVYPAFVAINQFINQESSEIAIPSEIAELLIHMVEHRVQPGLGSALKFSGDLIKADSLSKDAMDRISRALPDIIEEYRYDQDRLTVPSMAELPTVRREVYRITRVLVEKYPELGALMEALSTDPLPEVRNCDMGTGDLGD